MGFLRRIENGLEGVFEGGIGRTFRSHVQPVELARKLAKEMDDHRTISVSQVYVPNVYTLYLAPPDREQFATYEASLRTSSRRTSASTPAARATPCPGRIRVLIESAEELPLGSFGISVAMQEAPRARPAPSRGPTAACATREGELPAEFLVGTDEPSFGEDAPPPVPPVPRRRPPEPDPYPSEPVRPRSRTRWPAIPRSRTPRRRPSYDAASRRAAEAERRGGGEPWRRSPPRPSRPTPTPSEEPDVGARRRAAGRPRGRHGARPAVGARPAARSRSCRTPIPTGAAAAAGSRAARCRTPCRCRAAHGLRRRRTPSCSRSTRPARATWCARSGR